MTTEWDNNECLKFLELYQANRVIWDPTHIYHRDKHKVNDAWVRLSHLMNRPINELKKKKDSLMATFRCHVRRKKASINNGAAGDDIYKPIWFAYDFMEKFLAPALESNLTAYMEQTLPMDEASAETTLTYDGTDDRSDFGPNQSQQPYSNAKTSAPTENTTPFVSHRRKKRRKNSLELQEAEAQMNEAFSILKDVVRQEDDDCELYGKMLARKLRKLDDIGRQIVMHKIDGMVIDALVRQNYPFLKTAPIREYYFREPSSQPSAYSDDESPRTSRAASTSSENAFLVTTPSRSATSQKRQSCKAKVRHDNQEGSDIISQESQTAHKDSQHTKDEHAT